MIYHRRLKKIAHSWLTAIFTLFISFSGIVLSLMCIYSLPDLSVRPSIGSLFYLLSSLTVSIYLTMQWRGLSISNTQTNSETKMSSSSVISDNILKWFVAMFTLSFILLSFGIALICIYALPDHSVQAGAGAMFFLGGLVAIVALVYIVWKNW